MKKVFKYIFVLFFVAILTGCGKKNLDGTVTALLEGIKKGNTNEVVKKYCSNYELLQMEEDDDLLGIRKLIFSKLSYNVIDTSDNGDVGKIYLELTTVDVNSVFEKLQSDLVKDEEYLKLSSDEMKEYSLNKEKEMINNLSNEYYRIVKISVDAKKEDGIWKINLTDEFIYALSGLSY